MHPINPKLNRSAGGGRAHWYPYYAGYSPLFVAEMLVKLDLGKNALVLDPWNGSGTTTTVCAMNGVTSAGLDINPSMVAVAKARLLSRNISASLGPLLDAALERAQNRSANESDKDEPLLAWFSRGTARRFRAIERSVYDLFVGANPHEISSSPNVDRFSSLAAFFYVMIFRLVRASLRLSTTNPTWVKSHVDDSMKVALTWREISSAMRSDLAKIQLLDTKFDANASNAAATLSVGDSRLIPMADDSVDAVITSPPYCTRIDYAISTRVELAVLQISLDERFAELRRNMLGTVVTRGASLQGFEDIRSGLCHSLLSEVAAHPSKASSGYYLLFFTDYFSKLSRSIDQLARVVKRGGTATFVVQDSAYKEIHIDLPAIVEETFISHGFRQEFRWNFRCSKNMRNINSQARWHNRKWNPTESILVFKKN